MSTKHNRRDSRIKLKIKGLIAKTYNSPKIPKSTHYQPQSPTFPQSFTIVKDYKYENTNTIGPQGIQGKDGHTGPQGNDGKDGHTGPQGIQGKDGHTGPQGNDGKDGHTGPQGIQGKDGKDGLIGPQGIQGKDGKDGLIGPQGIQGKDGKDGLIGPQGKDGKDGLIGPQGIQGEVGPMGNPAKIPEIYKKSILAEGGVLHLKNISSINSNISGESNGFNNLIINSVDSNTYGNNQMLLGGEGLKLLYDDAYAIGKFNYYENEYQVSIGNGISDDNRSNSWSISKEGNMNTNKIMLTDQMIPHVGIYYESFDGKKIPHGTAVIFHPGTTKIRECQVNETPIGIVAPTAYIIYGSAEDHWIDKYERDLDGKIIMDVYEDIIQIPSIIEEDVEIIEEVINYTKNPIEIREIKQIKKMKRVEKVFANKLDENGNIVGNEEIIKMTKKVISKTTPKISSLFESNRKYIPRSRRDEWHIIAVAGLSKLNKRQQFSYDWVEVESHPNFDYFLVK